MGSGRSRTGRDQAAMQRPMPSTVNQSGEAAKPPLHPCPQCAQNNTADSRFCNSCGAPLRVTACPHCGAVNPTAASSCRQCHGELQVAGADVLISAAAGVETYEPLPRPPVPVVVWVAGGVILVALTFLGYYVYQMFSYVDIPFERATRPAEDGLLEGRRGPSVSGAIGPAPVPAASDESATKTGRGVPAPPMPSSNTETAPGKTARTPVDTRRASRRTAEPCTEEAAAIGLCSRGLKRATGPETPAKAESSIAPPPPDVVRKPAGQAPTAGSQPCTAEVWALGLCKTESVQRKE